MSLDRVIRRGLARRDFAGPWGDPYRDGTIPPPTWDGAYSGPPINEDTALHLIDAYACVSLLVDDALQLPINEFEKGNETRKPLDPPAAVIAQPDPEIERWDWVSRTVSSLALRGNAYSAVLALDPATFLPSALRAIHPDDISPKRDNKGRIIYKLSDGTTLTKEQVVHIPLVTLAGGLTGLSPIDCARRGIRLSVNTEAFGDAWFTDGAAPSSVLETDQAKDDTWARRQQAKWVVAHGGGRRRPGVLTGGLKWRPITITPNESQFLETRKLNTSQIARIWRVPPHMIGDLEKSSSWGSGIEEQSIGYVVHTLAPYLVRIETALSRLTPVGRYVKFKVAALLRGNTRDRYLAYAIGRQWGWLSVNDIRELEDLPPVEGGDTYLQPLNMIDAEQALKVLLSNPSGGGDGSS